MSFEHPDVVLCPGGPMLLRGDHRSGRRRCRRTRHPAGDRGLPLRALGASRGATAPTRCCRPTCARPEAASGLIYPPPGPLYV